jgi:hypothetical protein
MRLRKLYELFRYISTTSIIVVAVLIGCEQVTEYRAARERAARIETGNRITTLAMALNKYFQQHDQYPPQQSDYRFPLGALTTPVNYIANYYQWEGDLKTMRYAAKPLPEGVMDQILIDAISKRPFRYYSNDGRFLIVAAYGNKIFDLSPDRVFTITGKIRPRSALVAFRYDPTNGFLFPMGGDIFFDSSYYKDFSHWWLN